MQEKQRYIDQPIEGKNQNTSIRSVLTYSTIFIAAFITIYMMFFKNSVSLYPKEKLLVSIEKTSVDVLVPPTLPDITNITVEAVQKKIPKFVKGKAILNPITLYPEFRKFLEDDAARHLRLAQRRVNPRALVVEKGHYNWKMLYEEIERQDFNEQVLQKEGNIYTLKVPLLVAYGASLTISGKDIEELRLSQEGNAYLVSAGDLFIVNTKVVGWNEEKKASAKFADKHQFRPFIVNWAGGHLNLAGSHFISLGYLKGKSYGISYSACTPCAKIHPDRAPSTGIVVGNQFTDLFYGFYSYEAEDVAIVGNVYDDNIVYAIDPHDRSKRLIIAKNETYGTKEKHGIIVSREVNDSWIFNNYSHHNEGSGIMIDRTSVNNIIANNLVEYNKQDGLTFFESQDNMTWNNVFRYNEKNGIRIRNSWNIKLYNDEMNGNKGTSIELYTADLSGQKTRDFELDPYTQKATATVNGAKISTSGAAVFKIQNAELLELTNVDARAATHVFPVSFDYDEALLKQNISSPDVIVKVQNETYPSVEIPVPSHTEEPE